MVPGGRLKGFCYTPNTGTFLMDLDADETYARLAGPAADVPSRVPVKREDKKPISWSQDDKERLGLHLGFAQAEELLKEQVGDARGKAKSEVAPAWVAHLVEALTVGRDAPKPGHSPESSITTRQDASDAASDTASKKAPRRRKGALRDVLPSPPGEPAPRPRSQKPQIDYGIQ
jgi:hypothetical protein